METKIDPSVILNIPDIAFDHNTSDEDNINEPELYESDPWTYIPTKSIDDRIAQSVYIDGVLKTMNNHQQIFSDTYKKSSMPTTSSSSSSSSSSTNSKSTTIAQTENIEQIVKKPRIESGTKPTSAFAGISVPDEISNYINGSTLPVLNYGSGNTFECGVSFKKHKIVIFEFITFFHEHLLHLLPKKSNTPVLPIDEGFSFMDFESFQKKEQIQKQPSFNSNMMTKISTDNEQANFGICLNHPYFETSQFNIIQNIIQPSLNKKNDPETEGLELGIQSNSVIRIHTEFLNSKKISKNGDEKRIIWENIIFYISKEETENQKLYDIFLILFVKYSVKSTSFANTIPDNSNTSKLLKAYIFLKCNND